MNHPEAEATEVLIGNMFAVDFRHVGWSTKRLGKAAFDSHGKHIPNFRPAFVAKAELLAVGVDITAPPPLDHRW
jgi:hypothetical protein